MPDLVTGFALVAVVLTVAGLASGFVERAPLSFPIIFLGLGFLLGDRGLGVLSLGPESALLETVAPFTLAMVLCLEAVRIGNIGMSGAGFIPVAVLNFDLCQCFLDYGDTTSEMAMLLSFILFGVVISDLFTEMSLILAGVVILVARPLAMAVVLSRASISNRARMFIGWFGPRGLNSLLLALLVIHAGVANSEYLLAIVGVVVTVSVVAHGASATPLSQAYGRAVEAQTHEEERENAGGIFRRDGSTTIRVGPTQLAEMLDSDEPPVVLDVRTRSQFEQDRSRIPGAIRLAPDEVDNWARERKETFDRRASIVAYCT